MFHLPTVPAKFGMRSMSNFRGSHVYRALLMSELEGTQELIGCNPLVRHCINEN